MEKIESYYFEKYSEDLDALVESYCENSNVSEEFLNKIHLELATLFNSHLQKILHELNFFSEVNGNGITHIH